MGIWNGRAEDLGQSSVERRVECGVHGFQQNCLLMLKMEKHLRQKYPCNAAKRRPVLLAEPVPERDGAQLLQAAGERPNSRMLGPEQGGQTVGASLVQKGKEHLLLEADMGFYLRFDEAMEIADELSDPGRVDGGSTIIVGLRKECLDARQPGDDGMMILKDTASDLGPGMHYAGFVPGGLAWMPPGQEHTRSAIAIRGGEPWGVGRSMRQHPYLLRSPPARARMERPTCVPRSTKRTTLSLSVIKWIEENLRCAIILACNVAELPHLARRGPMVARRRGRPWTYVVRHSKAVVDQGLPKRGFTAAGRVRTAAPRDGRATVGVAFEAQFALKLDQR